MGRPRESAVRRRDRASARRSRATEPRRSRSERPRCHRAAGSPTLAREQPAARARLGARPRVRARRARPSRAASRTSSCSNGSTRRSPPRVVSDVPGAPGRLRFAHVLIRDTLYEGLTSARRVRLHEPRASRRSSASQRPIPPSSRATRSPRATTRAVCATPARRPTARSAARLRRGRAPLPARARGARARSRPIRGAASCCWQSATRSPGPAAWRRPRRRSSPPAIWPATRACPSFARAALGYGGSTGWQRAGDDTRLVPLLEEALRTLGDDGPMLRARLLARLAGALRDRAVARAAVVAEPRGGRDRSPARRQGHARLHADAPSWPPGDPTSSELVAIADEVSGLAAETGSADAVLDALTLKGIVGLADARRRGRRRRR